MQSFKKSFELSVNYMLSQYTQYTIEKLKAYAVDCEFKSISHFVFRFLETIKLAHY